MASPPWDSTGKGADVVLSSGNRVANCIGLQECVRTTLGIDPAIGGPDLMVEILVPGIQPGGPANCLRPIFGMCNATYAIATATALGFENVNAWGFYTGAQGIAANGKFHNGVPAGNWDPGGGGTGGLSSYYQLVYSPTGKSFTLYRNGVVQLFPFSSGVGANGVLQYFAFGSGSSPADGELGTLNTGYAAFAFPIAGTQPFDPVPPAGQLLAVF